MQRLSGRRALVTGAASGIGRATATRIAEEGAVVACADIDAVGAREAAASIIGRGGTATGVPLDIADPNSCEAAVRHTVDSLGGLDILANVAGIFHPGHTLEQDISVFDTTIAVNLKGTFYMCRFALPSLLDGGGAIVNISSAAALQGVPYNAAYCASKAGIVGLTRSLASEYARRRVRVNCICPGGIMTPLIESGFPVEGIDSALMARLAPQMKRIGTPEEVAALVAYLGSDESSYMTGSVITIDGGQLA